MRYLVRQKIFSFRDTFTIKDEYGNDCFKVFGRIFSFGNKLTLTDLLDQELYYIEQRVFRFLPEYTIYQNGNPVATVKKNLTLFRPSFDISSVYGNFNIDGNFWAYDFTVFKNGSPQAILIKTMVLLFRYLWGFHFRRGGRSFHAVPGDRAGHGVSQRQALNHPLSWACVYSVQQYGCLRPCQVVSGVQSVSRSLDKAVLHKNRHTVDGIIGYKGNIGKL